MSCVENTGRASTPHFTNNTIIVTAISLTLFSWLVRWLLMHWQNGNPKNIQLLGIYILFYCWFDVIPIRLGTLDLVRLIKVSPNLQDTIWSFLIPFMPVMGMPIATFVLTAFIMELLGEMSSTPQKWTVHRSGKICIAPRVATDASSTADGGNFQHDQDLERFLVSWFSYA